MRPRQTLLLGLLLLVPVLAFLFLYRFGTNRYALPTYLPDRVDSTQVGGKWRRDTVFHQLAPFRLRTSAGLAVSSAELSQGMYIVQFYQDDDASARAARELLRLQEKFRHEPKVKLATIVLNPGANQAATLEKLAEKYGTIAGKWFVLTGPADTLQQLAQREFRLAANPKRIGGTAAFPANLPSGRLLLVDRDRRVRGIYDGTDGREIDRLITEITVQLYDYEHPH
jgi:protein SCO1/2